MIDKNDIDADVRLHEAMCGVRSIGMASNLITLLAHATVETRQGCGDDDPIMPRQVADARYHLLGIDCAHITTRRSLELLAGHGYVERVPLEPESGRNWLDWRPSADAWRLLRFSGLALLVFDRADTPLPERRLGHPRSNEHREIQAALQTIDKMSTTAHLCTLVAVAVLDRRGVNPINGPRVVDLRSEWFDKATSEQSLHQSIGLLGDLELVGKRRFEERVDHAQIDIRPTVEGWRVLNVTRLWELVRDAAISKQEADC